MSDAPERIWIDAAGGRWSPVSGGTQGVEYVRADALPAVQVTVKPLEWVDFADRGAKAQAWNYANYTLQKWSDGRWELGASYSGYTTSIYGIDRFFPTFEAAKAAAQADYEARIRSALTVTPAPDAALVAALPEATVQEAVKSIINNLSSTYTARNGRKMTIEGDVHQVVSEGEYPTAFVPAWDDPGPGGIDGTDEAKANAALTAAAQKHADAAHWKNTKIGGE